MIWIGEQVKKLAKEKGLTLASLAKELEVSRQTVNDWVSGQVPKGNHLVLLCRILGVLPGDLFSDKSELSITIPIHRTRRTAKITPAMQQDAMELAEQYELFFRNAADPGVVPVVRVKERDRGTAKMIASQLRSKCRASDDRPLDYDDVFNLLAGLGIVVVFRYFPATIKGYAFYTRIHKHRVVFVNNSTNVIDLIFQLLHETVHAVRDEAYTNGGYDTAEESFCDSVANYLQFPSGYINLVYDAIEGLNPGTQVNKLKTFAQRYKHSLYGIAKRIQESHPGFKLTSIGGADTNLKKEFPAIGDLLFRDPAPLEYIKKLRSLSPHFVDMLYDQLDSLSLRKLGEILGLDSSLDARSVKDAIINGL